MSRPGLVPPPLRPLLGGLLEQALARVVALDPETVEALSGLEGRRIGLELEAPPLALELRVEKSRLRIGPPGEEPDLAVKSGLAAALSMLFPGADRASPGRVRISGDAALAQRLQRLASRFDPDWDEAFARVFGDVLGHQLAKSLRAALGWGRDTAGALARDGVEFLTEESRDLVAGAEIEAFCEDVDTERDRAERLQARLRRMADRLA